MLLSFVNSQYCYTYTIDQISTGLLLYSYLVPAIISTLFGIYLLYKTKTLQSITLSVVCFVFSIWAILNLSTWFSFLGSFNTMFTWSILDLFGLIFFLFAYYFLYSFINNHDLPTWEKFAGLLLLSPTVVWTFFGYNLSSFNADYCEALENSSVTNYPYLVELLLILAVVFLTIQSVSKSENKTQRKKVILAGTGVFVFLLFFLVATFGASLLVEYNIWQYAYNIEIYGMFGMPVLLVLLGFLIVRYRAFNIKLLGAPALVFGLIALIGSQFTFIQSNTNRILTAITLVLTGAIGIYLIRSVRKEVTQREHIEKLAKDLQKANAKLKELDKQKTEFLSFASHQLRSPMTAIKGYASMILEGSFGPLEDKARGAVEIILQSTQKLVLVIEDFLNVSRIELGKMKYDKTKTDVKELVIGAVKQFEPTIKSRGLSISTEIDESDSYVTTVDPGKISQVVSNLIDNAAKYTPKGEIKVQMSKIKDKIQIRVKDTGVGLDSDALNELFQKFNRAGDGSKLNVSGTGLGLYVTQQLVTAHNGKMWAESEGKGKGSTFVVELPIV